jgi:hypothetical protein
MEDGIVDPTEMTAALAAMTSGIRAQIGDASTQANNPAIIKTSFMMVPFKQSHNISSDAGRGANGCKDCHITGAGFYNGKYPVNGNMAKLATGTEAQYQSGRKVVAAAADSNYVVKSNQITVFTKVNSLSDTTDSHPSVLTKKGDRTVPVVLLNAFDKPFDTTAPVDAFLRDIDRSELLYEATFKKVDAGFKAAPIVGTAVAAGCGGITTNASGRVTGFSPFYCEDASLMGAPGFTGDPLKSTKAGALSTRGWLLKIDVDKDNNGVFDTAAGDVSRTKQLVGAGEDKITDMAGFVAALGTFATGFEFTITQSGGALTISPNSATQPIRLNVESDLGNLGLTNAIHVADPIVRTDERAIAYANATPAVCVGTPGSCTGATFATRAAYVSYLDSIAAAPVANISTIPGVLTTPETETTPAVYTIPVGTAATFATTQQPGVTYEWKIMGTTITGTGTSFSVTPTTAGGFYVNLISTNTVTGAKALTQVLMKAEVVLSDAFGATASVVAGTTKKVQIALSGMPAHTGIQIVWGDGAQSNSYVQSASEFTPMHFYYKTAPVGGFTATVKLTNAGRVVAQKQVTGILAPPPVEP